MNDIRRLINDIDDSFLDDFAENVKAELDNIECSAMDFHLKDDFDACLEVTLSSVENIKMNCRLIFMDPLLSYMQSIEEFIVCLRQGKIPVKEDVSELLLIAFDEVRAATDDLCLRRNMDCRLLQDFHDAIMSLTHASPDSVDVEVRSMIMEFSHRVDPDLVFAVKEVPAYEPRKGTTNIEDDLSFFRDIAESIENSSEFFENRSQKTRNVCLLINRSLTEGVDENQLIAAVYMHDMAMVYLPHEILFKKGRYTAEERMMLEQHPIQTYGYLSRIPSWRQAAEIVLQHHEHFDGSGYPHALKSEKICLGARILSIADAYVAVTNERSDRSFKKSPLRAFSELNKYSGFQFDPVILDAFNSAALCVGKK